MFTNAILGHILDNLFRVMFSIITLKETTILCKENTIDIDANTFLNVVQLEENKKKMKMHKKRIFLWVLYMKGENHGQIYFQLK